MSEISTPKELAPMGKIYGAIMEHSSAEFLGLEWMCYQICSLAKMTAKTIQQSETSEWAPIAGPEEVNKQGAQDGNEKIDGERF